MHMEPSENYTDGTCKTGDRAKGGMLKVERTSPMSSLEMERQSLLLYGETVF